MPIASVLILITRPFCQRANEGGWSVLARAMHLFAVRAATAAVHFCVLFVSTADPRHSRAFVRKQLSANSLCVSM